MILSQALNAAAMKNPGAAAVLDLGKTLSYSDMRKKVAQLSYLHQAEIGHGKRIAFLSQNTQAAALSFFAFSNIGCQSIFFDPADSPEEIVQAVKDLEITHICVSGDQLSRVNDIIRTYALGLTVVEIEKKKGGEYDPSYSPPPDHPLKETDPVLALRQKELGQETKYIFFTHKQLYTAATGIRRFYHFGANEKVMTSMSWAHPFSLVHGLLLPLFAGVTLAVNPQSPTHEEFIEYLAKNQINRFVDNPKFYYFLLSICMSAKYMLPGVRSVTVGAGNLSKSIRKTFNLLHIPVLQTYGRVEAVWTLAMEDSEKAKDSPAPAMLALPGFKYKVLNEEGDEIVSEGMRDGPLAIAGEAIMSAYFHPDKAMAEKASKVTIRGTWFYTGEIGRLEGEGEELAVRSLGPASDVLRSGTKFLVPEKIDDVARGINDVLDAAAFVRLDEKGNPSFGLAVVRQGKALSEAMILDQLKTRLSGKELPNTIHFMDAIPRDRFENVNRGALQRQFSAR
jgi:acyl-CoA synthetase (AMP-forming)/AMP-acid ligase II